MHYHPARELPEALENYDSFQVNSKCPVYQDFIAKIRCKKQKTLRDWEYLVAYDFSRFGDKRYYEGLVAPVSWNDLNSKNKHLVPGLQYFYLKRDYAKAVEFFDKQAKRNQLCESYELLTRALFAAGNYKEVITTLSLEINKLEKTIAKQYSWDTSHIEPKEMFMLIRGAAYIKERQMAAALADFSEGVRLREQGRERYKKIHDMLRWERARLLVQLGRTHEALEDLAKIKYNRACRHYTNILANNI